MQPGGSSSAGSLGEHLIFLISQPRSGSTLLQRILGGHDQILTESESWLMLHPLYALREEGYEAEYEARWAREGLLTFLAGLPGGETEYIEGVRRMYGYLYSRAISASGKRLYLDKTPRYYLILHELIRVFPNARYVILFRNPLAVLCSILTTYVRKNWGNLRKSRRDLLVAPFRLCQGVRFLGPRAIVAHYEPLVTQPEDEVRHICENLSLPFTTDLLKYGEHGLKRWNLGDPTSIHQYKTPQSTKARAWERSLEDPVVWRLASDYLELLPVEILGEMGYRKADLQTILDAHRRRSLRPRPSLMTLLADNTKMDKRSEGPRIRSPIPRKGVAGIVRAVVVKTLRTMKARPSSIRPK